MKNVPASSLAWGGAALTVLLLVLAVVVLLAGREIDHQAMLIKTDSVPGLVQGHTIRSRYAEGFIYALQAMGAETAAKRESLIQRIAALDEMAASACDAYRDTIFINPRQDIANFKAVLAARDRYLHRRTEFISLLQSGSRETAQRFFLAELTPDYDALMQACDTLVAYNNGTGTIISASLMTSIAQLRWTVIAVIVLAVLAGLSVGTNLASRRRSELALRESEKKFSAAFEFSPHAMSISRRASGRIIAANRAFHVLFELADQEAVGKTPIDLGVWSSEAERQERMGQLKRDGRLSNLVRELGLPGGRKKTVLLSVEPIVTANEDCFLGVAQDITERKTHEREIERLSRLYQVLSLVNQTLVRANNQTEVFREICRTLVEVGQFKLAWIGCLDPATRLLVPLAVAGDTYDYLPTIRVSTDADVPEGRGPSGVAFRENRPYVCNDFVANPATLPWREAAARNGIQSSMALPLRWEGKTAGLLTVYAGEKDFFQKREIELINEVAGDISFALDVFADRKWREKAEAELRQSEAQFRSTMTHSAIGMAIVAPDHRVIDVNPALCVLVGYTREEILAKTLLAVTHPDDRGVGSKNFHRALTGEFDSYAREKRYLHKDGHEIWAQLTVSLVRNHLGQPQHFIAQVQDVTERKRTLGQLAELTMQLELALTIARLCVFQHWPETGQTTWDARMYELFGVSRGAEPPTFAQFTEWIHPDDRTGFRTAWQSLLQGDRPLSHRFRALRPAGGYRHFELHASLHRAAPGSQPWVLGVNADVTEVVAATTNAERYRTQLIQSQKMETLGQLAGGVAHDFNNLLTGINGFVELAALTLAADHEATAMLEHAKRAAGNARDLVRRILVFSRQAPAYERTPLRLSDVVRNTAPLVSTLLPSTISLRLDLAATEPHVLADAGQIQQIVMNLCANASHAIGKTHGSLKISVDTCEAPEPRPNSTNGKSLDDRRVRLRISDSGCGMSQETLGRIFEPFFTTKEAGEGTGLGLSIVQSIVQEHGAIVTIDSEVGRGTTFTLLFPGHEPSAPPETASLPPFPADRGEEVIMVIDDEPTIVTLATAILSRAGYTVVACSSVQEAWRTFARDAERIDLVLTDYTMSELTGLEFMQRAHALVPDLAFVIMSANPGQVSLDGHQQVRVLQKPFESVDLLRAVREQLRAG